MEEASPRTALRRVKLDKNVKISYSTPAKGPRTVTFFNEYLSKGARNPKDDGIRKQLWKWYSRIKSQFPEALVLMSDETWNIMWATQSHTSPINDNRMAHLRCLAKDMQSVGSARFYMTYLDTVSDSGGHNEAALEWIQWYNSTPEVTQPEFLEQGIKLVARVGMFNFAQLILYQLAQIDPQAVPRAFKNIFTAQLYDDTPDAVKKAWEVYVDVQDQCGDDMLPSDYEFFWMGFSRAGARDLATRTFQHMVRSKIFLSSYQQDMPKFYAQLLGMVKSATSVDEVNQLFLPMLDTLLQKTMIGLFFTTWLKRILDFYDSKTALTVVELGYEKGYVPEPRIMDQILNNWVSSPTATRRDLEMAEEIALRMVAQRIENVQAHNRPPKQKETVWKRRPVPPATSATFAVLLDIWLKKHSKRHLSKEAARVELANLVNRIKECRLTLDSKALSIVLQSHLQAHDFYMIRETIVYQMMNAPAQNLPKEHSIVLLWNACYLNNKRRGSRFMTKPERVNLRAADIMQVTLQSLKHHWRGRVRTMNTILTRPRIMNMIIKCFCGESDWGGALMTLRVFAERFGVYPTPAIIEIIARRVASLAYRTRSPRQRRELAAIPLFQEDTARLIQIMREMFNMRVESETMAGEEVGEARRADLMVETLTKFLRITMLRRFNPTQVEDRIMFLRKRWGAEDCSLGESTATEIYIEMYMNGALEQFSELESQKNPQEGEVASEEEEALPEENLKPKGQEAEPENETVSAEEGELDRQECLPEGGRLSDDETLNPPGENQQPQEALQEQKDTAIKDPMREKQSSWQGRLLENTRWSIDYEPLTSWRIEERALPKRAVMSVGEKEPDRQERLREKARWLNDDEPLETPGEKQRPQEALQEQEGAAIKGPVREEESSWQGRLLENARWLSDDEPRRPRKRKQKGEAIEDVLWGKEPVRENPRWSLNNESKGPRRAKRRGRKGMAMDLTEEEELDRQKRLQENAMSRWLSDVDDEPRKPPGQKEHPWGTLPEKDAGVQDRTPSWQGRLLEKTRWLSDDKPNKPRRTKGKKPWSSDDDKPPQPPGQKGASIKDPEVQDKSPPSWQGRLLENTSWLNDDVPNNPRRSKRKKSSPSYDDDKPLQAPGHKQQRQGVVPKQKGPAIQDPGEQEKSPPSGQGRLRDNSRRSSDDEPSKPSKARRTKGKRRGSSGDK